MSSLRRDLLERRLWPIVAILLLAIVAVPFLLARHHSTVSTTFPTAPLATPVTTGAGTGGATYSALSASAPRTTPVRDSTRDPFGAGASTTATRTTPPAKTAGSSDPGTTTGGAPAPSSPASTPTSSDSGSSDSSAATLAAALKNADGSTTPATTVSSSPTTSTPTVTTTASSPPGSASTPAPATHRYTIRTVDLRLKTPGGTLSVVDAARLSPLPSASWPKLMFMGTTADGSAAVFALEDSVTASGVADCRPSHDNCALIELPARRMEKIGYWLPDLGERTLELEVTRIVSRVTTSRAEAEAAYARQSAVGLCELQLGDPIQYQYHASDGSLASQSGSACTRRMAKVPFPGQASGSGL